MEPHGGRTNSAEELIGPQQVMLVVALAAGETRPRQRVHRTATHLAMDEVLVGRILSLIRMFPIRHVQVNNPLEPSLLFFGFGLVGLKRQNVIHGTSFSPVS